MCFLIYLNDLLIVYIIKLIFTQPNKNKAFAWAHPYHQCDWPCPAYKSQLHGSKVGEFEVVGVEEVSGARAAI